MTETIRNNLGQFVTGHKALNLRDATTGRFTKITVDKQDRYIKTRIAVDELLSKEVKDG